MHTHGPISEIAVIGFSLISTIASGLMLADAPPAQAFALQWFLLPLLGALSSSVCSMLLNPHPEARKTVLARSIFGVVAGCGIPKVASMVHPALHDLSFDPAVAFLAGFIVCMIGYIIARPFVEKLYGRAGDIAAHIEGEVERRIESVVKTEKVETVKTTTADIDHKTIGTLLAIVGLFLSGCAGLPQRTYSLSYTDEQGRQIGAGVTLGDTRK